MLLLGLQKSELSVMFVGSRMMARLNYTYRGKKGTTDVLSFPMDSCNQNSPCPALGDIVICVPSALVQAREYNILFYEELLRLLIHGLLHLSGYDHERNDYQKIRMRKKERELINAIAQVD